MEESFNYNIEDNKIVILNEKSLLLSSLESMTTTFDNKIKTKTESTNKIEICEVSKLKIDSNDSMMSSIEKISIEKIDDNKINKILDELVNLVKLKSSSNKKRKTFLHFFGHRLCIRHVKLETTVIAKF